MFNGATAVATVLAAVVFATASEYPERECCDPIDLPPSPPPPSSGAVAIKAAAAARTTTVAVPREEKASKETLNCLLARSLCNEDPSCYKIINLIPSLCGNEIVSCSTTTVIKCRAALKTLQAFPFFKPTCLCREPKIDRECNSFRNFLFDHPCNFTLRKEDDPFFIDTLTSCSHALTVCESSADCFKTYEDFKRNCKVGKDNTCEAPNPEDCHKAWINLRKTPIFGCICPQNQMKKRCDRIFSLVNDNPCINPESAITTDNSILNFQSTCHEALETCNKQPYCQEMVASIFRNCNQKQCKKTNCMESLQSFYRNDSMAPFAIEIAFCLCKKSGVNKDKCLVAQEMLHPECAQRADGPGKVPCHALAETCRTKPECRSRLEAYEQTCSVDALTSRCAGPPSECRKSIVGVLGTILRTNCVCKDTSPVRFNDCMGWQRVFWFNSCVVEAQRDFHMIKIKNLNGMDRTSPRPRPSSIVPKGPRRDHRRHRTSTTAVGITAVTTTFSAEIADVPTTTTSNIKVLVAGKKFKSATTVSPSTAVSTITSTTTTTPAPQIPLHGCSLQRSPHYNKQFLAEGDVIRLHSLEDNSCSEVCNCKIGESLTCQTVCVEVEPCHTEIAFYHHESPAYIAFRGRCICYVGRFICMRPKTNTYSLKPGVFLFLGYSEKDEALLKGLDIIQFEIGDLVYTIQKFIQDHIKSNTTCKLYFHSLSFENMIIVGKASPKLAANGGYAKNTKDVRSSVIQDSLACFDVLKNFSYMVTTQAMPVKTNLLLSLLKIAEVDVLLPALSSSWSPITYAPSNLIISLSLVIITVLLAYLDV
ncbi:uncharacterized protein LOC126837037 [Adelges cooleyi]|uniref:uncharacterized protein LOC126837037 n=1 Tax=Adelges cooleyi TaxID=133065 RepID=UPI002180449C|nr:uncharacterized protein LOC126837037 [Adelges cooleyi]